MSNIDAMNSRGYRNKNPGNIDYNPANKWQGQLGREQTSGSVRPRFAVFDSHENGIRALAALLTTYYDRHKLKTINGIINRWAPSQENNTSAYARHVSLLTERGVNEVLNLHTYADMMPLVRAIITHELGGQPYPQSVIDEGLRRAGLPKPVATAAQAARTGTGQGVIAGTVVTGAVAVAVQAAPAISALNGLDWRVGVALVVAAGAAVVAWVLTRRKDRPSASAPVEVAPEDADPVGSGGAGVG